MVGRYLVQCGGCARRVVLRIQVGSTMAPGDLAVTQPFVFACPHCHAGIRGKVHNAPGGVARLTSEDFEVRTSAKEEPSDIAVTVATDVPVHLSLLHGRAGDVMLTPFIQMTSSMSQASLQGLMARIGVLRELRRESFPVLRRAALAFVRGDLDEVAKALAETQPEASAEELMQFDPVVLLGYAFMQAYGPLEDETTFDDAQTEKTATFEAAVQRDPAALVMLLRESGTDWLPAHGHSLIDACLTLLGDIEPLISGLCAEALNGSIGVADYRVMRDDFDLLKSRYQDVFELGSRSLAFMSQVANIAKRGDARSHVDGKKLTLVRAMKLKAYAREPWLVDFPMATRLYDPIRRNTRNSIGHRSVRYDFERGVLVYDDGVEENYLLFLVDYLQLVRLSHYLLEVVFTSWRNRRDDCVSGSPQA